MLQQTTTQQTNQPRKHHRSSVSKLSFDIIRDTNHPDTLAPTHAQVHLLAPFHATPTQCTTLHTFKNVVTKKDTLSGTAVAAFAAAENASSRRLDFRAGTKFSTVEILSAANVFLFHTAWNICGEIVLSSVPFVCSIPQLLSRVTAPMNCSCGSHFISPG